MVDLFGISTLITSREAPIKNRNTVRTLKLPEDYIRKNTLLSQNTDTNQKFTNYREIPFPGFEMPNDNLECRFCSHNLKLHLEKKDALICPPYVLELGQETNVIQVDFINKKRLI